MYALPKYVQLINSIQNAITEKQLKPEDQLPNEDDLAAEYGMSRGTVRKAITELERMGLVRKEQGRGTFINGVKPALSGFSLAEFDQYVRAKNQVPSTQTLTFEIIESDEQHISILDAVEGTPLFHVVQLRLASGTPIIYEERYFAKSLSPTLTAEMLNTTPLHHLLVDTYDVPLVRLQHTIELTTLPDNKFDLFRVDASMPVFSVERVSFTRRNDAIVPAVWYRALYRADEYQFHAQFHTSI